MSENLPDRAQRYDSSEPTEEPRSEVDNYYPVSKLELGKAAAPEPVIYVQVPNMEPLRTEIEPSTAADDLSSDNSVVYKPHATRHLQMVEAEYQMSPAAVAPTTKLPKVRTSKSAAWGKASLFTSLSFLILVSLFSWVPSGPLALEWILSALAVPVAISLAIAAFANKAAPAYGIFTLLVGLITPAVPWVMMFIGFAIGSGLA